MLLDGDKFSTKNKISFYVNEKINEQALVTNTMIPCRVLTYDEGKNYVTVETMFKITLKDGSQFQVPPLGEVPVAHFGGPSFLLTKKPAEGDNGLLLVSQRSIDEWKTFILSNQQPAQYAPLNKRMHDINDSIFIPLHFPSKMENGINYTGAIEFHNDFTSLFSLLDGILSAIEKIVTAILEIHIALNVAFNTIPIVGQAISATFTASTLRVITSLTTLKVTLQAEKLKLRSLLKPKTSFSLSTLTDLL